jgi:hypothetical protein
VRPYGNTVWPGLSSRSYEVRRALSEINPRELSTYVDLDLDELYTLLLPGDEKVLFSRGGAIARGQSIVRTRMNAIRRAVCPNRDADLDTLDLGILIATSMAADPSLGHLPLLPLTAIVLKIGIDSFCAQGADVGI